MKMMPKLRKHNYLTRIGIFLIAIALIVGTVSCMGDGNGNGNGEVGKLDHFMAYNVTSTWFIGQNVTLEDQFGTFNVTVWEAEWFCNPAEKVYSGNVTNISNPDHHFTSYVIYYKGTPPVHRLVEVDNQFGLQNLTVIGPARLLVPTQKEEHAAPVGLDHYLLYAAIGPHVPVYVNLTDQWGNQTEVPVGYPAAFATPVKKTHDGDVTDIVDPETHLVIYHIYGGYFNKTVQVANQFGNQALNVSNPCYLFVPSEKTVPPAPPLEHFKCYKVTDALPLGDFVDVMDQFNREYLSVLNVTVLSAEWFCNPVDKNGEGMTNPDNHLTVYNIVTMNKTSWNVTVDNQFGLQNLTVFGPIALAAPTWKLDPNSHGPPKYLDHFLLYGVLQGSPVDANVDLDDEFFGNAPGVNVTMPRYFANPALHKEHGDNYTSAWDPEAHLVFYDISDNPEFYWGVNISNQFELQSFGLNETGQLLAVPSEKVSYEQVGP